MELSYWQSRWNKGHIGFHMPGGYPGLQKHWYSLPIHESPRVLVPLCGKSEDLDFLCSHASRVVGVEVSEKAINDFFRERDIVPEKSSYHGFSVFVHKNLELWCGDFFRFPEKHDEPFSLIYDKAALIALPQDKRNGYAQKIKNLAIRHSATAILLHHYEYNQSEMSGPPFSVPFSEIESLYGSSFSITVLEQHEVNPSGFEKFIRRGLKSILKERFLFLHAKC
jgi:thiopurine S-methyltransferase